MPNGQRFCVPTITECMFRLWRFDVVGPLEVEEIIFGWLTDIGAKQELVKIIEFGSYVTCYLLITHKDAGLLDLVEVFKVDDTGKIEEIWAL